jgi:hypothetical protein
MSWSVRQLISDTNYSINGFLPQKLKVDYKKIVSFLKGEIDLGWVSTFKL